ncbi:tyrosine-type recombinase/integrase [Viridibacillus arvi]|uniref:tyrosine-type recombinase/integrase n=1 Tax=Viridibacillus arvi TaxID=263475 RepID=UPI0034CE412E
MEEINKKKAVDENIKKVVSYYEEELDIFNTYLEDLGYSTFTINSYVSDVQQFLIFIADNSSPFPSLTDVTPKTVQEFLRKTQKGNAKSTRNRRLMGLRTFFKSLLKSFVIDKNPALEIDSARTENNSLPTYLNDEELGMLFSSIKQDQNHIRNKCILMLMSLAGLRVIEIHNLNVTDIIRESGDPGIRVFGKGKKERYIPLPYALFSLLLDYEKIYRLTPTKTEHSNAFFVSRLGTRLARRSIQNISESAFQKLKSHPNSKYLQDKKLTAHKLRHTFGTRLVREGTDLVTIQELMGHSNLNTTQIYTHVNNKQKQEAMRKNDVSRFF